MMSQSPTSQKTVAGTLSRFSAGGSEELSFGTLLGALWRHKFTLSLCATIAILIGGYYAYVVATPKYAAMTSLALNVRNENLVDIDSVLAGVSTDYMTINTELEVIRSRNLLEKLVQELDLTEDPEFNASLRPPSVLSLNPLRRAVRKVVGLVKPAPPVDPNAPERAQEISPEQMRLNSVVDTLRRKVETSQLRDTYIFDIYVTTQGSMKSARIANALAELYVRDQIDQKFAATENAVTWLSERVVELGAELEEKQNAVKAMRTSMQLTSPEALEATNQQARAIRERLNESRATVAQLTARQSLVQDARQRSDLETLVTILADPVLNRLRQQVQNGDPNAQALLDSRLDTLTGQIATDLDRAQRQVDALQSSLSQVETQISSQTEQLVELEQLERDTAATQTLYETFLTRLKETTVQRGLQQADSRILSAATPGFPVAPRKARILVLSAILGLMFGGAIVALRQFFQKGFRLPTDLENATGLPILGQIPRFPIRKREQLVPYLRDKPTSAASESIRNMRTSITLSNVDMPPKVIMSTSSVPGEGKTTQAISLAINLSGLSKRVLLIEGDLRRRTFSHYFEFPKKQPGLITALQAETPLEQIIVHDATAGIDLLVGEQSQANAADIFASERFQALMMDLRDHYDYIVIDTPPVLIVPDALVIGQNVDSIILSVAWDRTPRNPVLETLRQLDTVNLKISGLVMSQIDTRGMKRYGYGSYYSNYNSGYYRN